jgi:hypothetical protein
MRKHGSIEWLLLAGLLLIPPALLIAHTSAADLKFQVQLIWGTDDPTPDDPDLKELEPKIKEQLHGVFKWKHYFEVSRKNVSIPVERIQRVKLSDKCEIEIQRSRRGKKEVLEVKLFGEGKLVVTHRQPLVPGELILIGGESINRTSWFVALVPLEND